MQQKKFLGFTLVEMLVVVGIIGILTTMILVSVSRVRKNAIDTRRKSNVEDVRGALTMYYATKNVFPDISGGWKSLMSTISSTGYISDTIPADEDGDRNGVVDPGETAVYTVETCTDCAMKLCAVCILTDCTCPDGGICPGGKYCVDVK